MNQIEQRLKEIERLPITSDTPALCKALRRADVKFSEIESLEINGVSNIAKWARDDILTILSGSDATEKWLKTHPDPRLRAMISGEEGQ